MSTLQRQLTPDDLLKMPDGDGYELVDGQLMELHRDQLSSWVAGEILCLVGNFAEDQGLGWVFPGGVGYQCFLDDPFKLRRADMSFITRDRMPDGPIGQGHAHIPPDLAVEVVSPRDSYNDIDHKITDFLEAGVRLVWVVNPRTRIVHVYEPREQSPHYRLSAGDELTGADMLPGFYCRVADLFPRANRTP